MAKINEEVLDRIRSDERFKYTLAEKLGRGFRTVEGWIRANVIDGPLTRVSAIEIIKKETGLKEDQILKETEAKIRKPRKPRAKVLIA